MNKSLQSGNANTPEQDDAAALAASVAPSSLSTQGGTQNGLRFTGGRGAVGNAEDNVSAALGNVMSNLATGTNILPGAVNSNNYLTAKNNANYSTVANNYYTSGGVGGGGGIAVNAANADAIPKWSHLMMPENPGSKGQGVSSTTSALAAAVSSSTAALRASPRTRRRVEEISGLIPPGFGKSEGERGGGAYGMGTFLVGEGGVQATDQESSMGGAFSTLAPLLTNCKGMVRGQQDLKKDLDNMLKTMNQVSNRLESIIVLNNLRKAKKV